MLLRGVASSAFPFVRFPLGLSVPKARQARVLSQSCLASPGAFFSSACWPLRTAAVVASSAGSTTATRSFADEAHPCAASRRHESSRPRTRRAARLGHLGARSRMSTDGTFASNLSRLLVAVWAAEAVGGQDLARNAPICCHHGTRPRPPRTPSRRARTPGSVQERARTFQRPALALARHWGQRIDASHGGLVGAGLFRDAGGRQVVGVGDGDAAGHGPDDESGSVSPGGQPQRFPGGLGLLAGHEPTAGAHRRGLLARPVCSSRKATDCAAARATARNSNQVGCILSRLQAPLVGFFGRPLLERVPGAGCHLGVCV